MDIPENVRKDLMKFLPASAYNEVACYILYDIHPRYSRKIDVIVCTHKGEVFEFYDRKPVSSLLLDNITNPREIIVLRNETCEEFYLVQAENEIIIISINGTMQIHRRIKNIERYELIDTDCSGHPRLKVICRDDAVPILFDKNFNLSQPVLASANKCSVESLPLLTQLLRKLTEAKYNVNKHEDALNEYMKLKQAAAFLLYEGGGHDANDSIFKLETENIEKELKIKTKSPIVKICNKQAVIITKVWNEDNVPIDNLHILLHGTSKLSFSYTTKIFKPMTLAPYWEESAFHCIKNNDEHYIVVVVDLDELKYNIFSRIDFEMVLSYRKDGKKYLSPLKSVVLTTLDVMGKNFDVTLDNEDDPFKILTILATSKKTDLVLRHIETLKREGINVYDEICKYIEFEVLATMRNVLVHKKSPYHVLFGLTLVFLQPYEFESNIKIEVYSRSPAQVLAFIHLLYDVIPYRLMATLPEHKISGKTEELTHWNDNISENLSQIDYSNHASAILQQATLIKDYFDKCIIKMNETNDQDVVNKIGQEIHLLSLGLSEYLKLRNQLLNEAMNGITSSSTNTVSIETQKMIVDD